VATIREARADYETKVAALGSVAEPKQSDGINWEQIARMVTRCSTGS
jgi:hypothetical protein